MLGRDRSVSMSDSAMSKLGKYELVERLAVGGMAELFKAQITGDHGFKKLVAIKKILPNLAANPAFVNMFVDEARITAMLEHPNIVQVFEFGQEGDELYLVMQLVDGVDLLDLMRKAKKLGKRLPTELAVHIAHQILEALDYAHKAHDQDGKPLGIVHRDISPGNVLVSRQGNVMLTDFGIAWAYERHQKTEAGKLKGKFGYMSPEQVAGAQLDPRSDVFSTGVLLAEMLINRHLFVGPSDLEVLLMVRDAELDRLHRHGGHIPDKLMKLLGKALARRPERRFASAAGFRDALADWLFSTGVRVTSSDLGTYVASVESSVEQLTNSRRAALLGKTPAPMALSGPETRQHRMDAARVADAARAEYVRRGTTRLPEAGEDALDPEERTTVYDRSGTGDVIDAAPGAEAEPGGAARDEPTERGDFTEVAPIHVLHELARREASGMLVAEGRAGILKEAYFKAGHPEYVTSNVLGERLGDYLIAKGVITEEQRAYAVEVMPHFDDHLLDTLIGLGLMDPLDALRQLSQQVRDKLIDVCTWPKGKYRWYEGRPNPWPTRKLHLDTYEIIGAGVGALDVPMVVAWAKQIRARRVSPRAGAAGLERFGLGRDLERALAMLDRTATVTELAGRIRDPEARLQFLRMLYLLVQCQLVAVV